jgi:hypothetical protein
VNADAAAVEHDAAGDGEAIDDGGGGFRGLEQEAAVAAAEGIGSVDDAGLRAGGAADGNGLAEEVEVAIAGAGIDAGGDDDEVAVCGGVNGGLDGGVLLRHVDGSGQGVKGQRGECGEAEDGPRDECV